MAIVSGASRQALLEIATVLQIQVQQNGATLPEGESISVDVAGDGQTVTIAVTLTGGMIIDAAGNPVFVVAGAPTPSEFPI